MNAKKIFAIFSRFRQANPTPTTELNYSSTFELLVAVMLSAHTTDRSVNLATKKLFDVAKTPTQMLNLGEAKLKEYIKSVGLYNTKAANLIKTCRILVDKFNSQIPDSREALQSLPGVGRKTANVVLNTIFKQPVMAVDTHIFRVSNRTKIATGKTPLEVEIKLLKVIPQEFLLDAHHWLILHGRYTCVAKKPKCPQCIIQDLCEYPNKTTLTELKPSKKSSQLLN